MRVVLDVSVFISYLSTPFSGGASSAVVQRLGAEEFTVIVSDPFFDELRGVVKHSAYIRQRVSDEALGALVERLAQVGEYAEVTGRRMVLPWRDPDDAYLFEMAFRSNADVLVSGDLDVLALRGSDERLPILSPAMFLVELVS